MMDGTNTTPPGRDKQNMSTQETQQPQERAMKQFTSVNNYLFTPPERLDENFSQQSNTEKPSEPATSEWQNKLPPIQAQTPPASPENGSLPSIVDATGYTSHHDAPLYPEDSADRPESQTPLFTCERPAVSVIPKQSQESNVQSGPAQPSQPARRDIFPAILGINNAEKALQYYQDRMRELKNFQQARSQLPKPLTSAHRARDPISQSQLQRVSRPTGVSKTRSAPKSTPKPKAASHTSTERSSPPKKRTPKARVMHDFVESNQQSAKHKRAPPSKKVEGENTRWTDLPDFAPPTSILDSAPKPLKASWHGNAVDLSTDADRSHLHAQELGVAATLRLSCAQYLSNKRKIFQARVQSLKDGKNFTKTAAQGACSIDVNKASQLWEAFEKVGWFKETWFEQFL